MIFRFINKNTVVTDVMRCGRKIICKTSIMSGLILLVSEIVRLSGSDRLSCPVKTSGIGRMIVSGYVRLSGAMSGAFSGLILTSGAL